MRKHKIHLIVYMAACVIVLIGPIFLLLHVNRDFMANREVLHRECLARGEMVAVVRMKGAGKVWICVPESAVTQRTDAMTPAAP